jgi:WD40 repeat protein
MDFDFRGTHNWLRNVITHEFTHIVQIQTTMKFGRRMPGLYLQWLGYESERRPDVLYGYPNVIASYPISGFLVPAWFAEGVAQYNRPQLRYDFWDTHRDMILRSYVLKDSMLTWNQMAVFGKTSLGNESSYNSGFAFVHYIAQQYGIAKLNEISRNLSSLGAVTIDGAIEKAVGKNGAAVYNEWREELKKEYGRRVAPINASLQEGLPVIFVDDEEEFKKLKEPVNAKLMFTLTQGITEAHRDRCGLLFETGFADRYPTFSPDGKKLAFVSVWGGSYLGQSNLVVGDVGGKFKVIQPGVGSEVCWSPDGRKLYYARTTSHNSHFSLQSDLYVYDLEKEEETRITYGKRAMSPSISPDGKTLVFVVGSDGTSNLATMNADTSNFERITSFKNGEQVYAPKWSSKGDRIVFDYSIRDGRDIAWIRPDGSEMEFLITGDDDARSSVFTPDGSHILFASDKTGIFNIYTYDVATKSAEQVTNVLGGAFMPTMSAKGELVYSNYTSKGYKLFMMDQQRIVAEGGHHYLPLSNEETTLPRPVFTQFAGDASDKFDWQSLRSYDDTKSPTPTAKSYKNVFTSLSFVPFIRFDNYNTKNKALESIKAGVYVFSNDVLEKLGFFAGAALNTKLERDLFAIFNYRGKLPLFYQLGLEPVASLEMYNLTRKTDNVISLPASTIPVDVTYNLTEFDVALTQWTHIGEIEFRYAHSRYTSNIESFVNYETTPPTLISGSSDLYLIANDLTLKYVFHQIARSNTTEINPVGRKVQLSINRSLNKFNGDGQYEVGATGLVPVYKNVNFTRVELTWREYIPFFFKNHTLAFKVRGGSILENTVDSFFDFYAGGLVGMKGYPFYSLGGNELAVVGLEYRFPLVSNIDVRFLQLYFDKFYASVYGDFGNAWSSEKPTIKEFKGDAGAELRLESFSWYSYPTRIFFNVSYGFNEFEKNIRGTPVKYGKEWRFYFGVLFGFDFD